MEMKQSKKVFRYDLIRAVAMLFVIMVHYNEMLKEYEIESPLYFTQTGPNMSFSQVGVCLFLLLSGALSAKSLERCLHADQGAAPKGVLNYYKKRFLSLMPAYYAAYIFAFLLAYLPGTPMPNKYMLFSLFGLDGYLLNKGVPVFYLVGEWFVGMILICYVVCPLLYLAVRRYPRIFAGVLLVYYVLIVSFFPLPWTKETDVLVRVVDFAAGMYLGLYLKRVPGKTVAVCLALTAVLSIVKLPVKPFDTMFVVLVQGMAAYLVLFWLGDRLEGISARGIQAVKKVISVWAGVSYAVYLVHLVAFRNCLYSLKGMQINGSFSVRMIVYCFCIMMIMGIFIHCTGNCISGAIERMAAACRKRLAGGR